MSTAPTGNIEEQQFSKMQQVTQSLSGVARQVWLAGLGVMALTGGETSHLFHLLVEKGKECEPSVESSWKKVRGGVSDKVGAVGKETSRLLEMLAEKGQELEPSIKGGIQKVREVTSKMRSVAGSGELAFDEKVLAAMQRLGAPTREDIQNLTRRVEAIASKLGVETEEPKPASEAEGEALDPSSSK